MKGNKHKGKLLSLLLALCMVLQYVPGNVFAQEEDPNTTLEETLPLEETTPLATESFTVPQTEPVAMAQLESYVCEHHTEHTTD